MNKRVSPIALFVYNRPRHTKKTLDALKKNTLAKESPLFIFSDGCKGEGDRKGVEKVREILHSLDKSCFKSVSIIKKKKNNGLAQSIISGVTEVLKSFDKVIVLEDDLVTSQAFLGYMNTMLDIYKDEKKIYSISGYNHPKKLMKIPKEYPYDIYFNPRASSWGWATWKDRWETVDWKIKDFEVFLKDSKKQKKFNEGGSDMSRMLIRQMKGELDSWAIRWCYHHFKNNAFCIYPTKSYIDNIGHDGSGVHCGESGDKFANRELNSSENIQTPKNIELNTKIMSNFREIYKNSVVSMIFGRILKIIK